MAQWRELLAALLLRTPSRKGAPLEECLLGLRPECRTPEGPSRAIRAWVPAQVPLEGFPELPMEVCRRVAQKAGCRPAPPEGCRRVRQALRVPDRQREDLEQQRRACRLALLEAEHLEPVRPPGLRVVFRPARLEEVLRELVELQGLRVVFPLARLEEALRELVVQRVGRVAFPWGLPLAALLGSVIRWVWEFPASPAAFRVQAAATVRSIRSPKTFWKKPSWLFPKATIMTALHTSMHTTCARTPEPQMCSRT